MKCSICGAPIGEEFAFCDECGAPGPSATSAQREGWRGQRAAKESSTSAERHPSRASGFVVERFRKAFPEIFDARERAVAGYRQKTPGAQRHLMIIAAVVAVAVLIGGAVAFEQWNRCRGYAAEAEEAAFQEGYGEQDATRLGEMYARTKGC